MRMLKQLMKFQELVTTASPKGQKTAHRNPESQGLAVHQDAWFTWRLEAMTGISKQRDDTLSPSHEDSPFSELLQAHLLICHKLNLIMVTKSQYQGMHVNEGLSHFTCIKLHPLPQNYS